MNACSGLSFAKPEEQRRRVEIIEKGDEKGSVFADGTLSTETFDDPRKEFASGFFQYIREGFMVVT